MKVEQKTKSNKKHTLLISIKGTFQGNYTEIYKGKGQPITQYVLVRFNCKNENEIKKFFFLNDKNLFLEKILEGNLKFPLLVEDPYFSSILQQKFKVKRNHLNEFWADENVHNEMKKLLDEIRVTKKQDTLDHYHQANFDDANTNADVIEDDDWGDVFI